MPRRYAWTRADSRRALCRAPWRSEDLRRWFLQNETELFKWRFQHNPPDDLNRWLANNGLHYEAISRSERDEIASELEAMARCRREEYSSQQEYYKASRRPLLTPPRHHVAHISSATHDPSQRLARSPALASAVALDARADGRALMVPQVRFEEVVDLIRQRRVYLRAGYAYVPQTDLVSIIATRVRAFLSKQLSMHARTWPALREEEADRIAGFLERLATCAPRATLEPQRPTAIIFGVSTELRRHAAGDIDAVACTPSAVRVDGQPPSPQIDERVRACVCAAYVGNDDFADGAKSSGVKANLADLPSLSRRSMPLCMSNMYMLANRSLAVSSSRLRPSPPLWSDVPSPPVSSRLLPSPPVSSRLAPSPPVTSRLAPSPHVSSHYLAQVHEVGRDAPPEAQGTQPTWPLPQGHRTHPRGVVPGLARQFHQGPRHDRREVAEGVRVRHPVQLRHMAVEDRSLRHTHAPARAPLTSYPSPFCGRWHPLRAAHPRAAEWCMCPQV
jgi:hypothetical protein